MSKVKKWKSSKDMGLYDPGASSKDADVIIKSSKLKKLEARIAKLRVVLEKAAKDVGCVYMCEAQQALREDDKCQ